jgi:predicted secreted protein
MAGLDAFGTTLSRDDGTGTFEALVNLTKITPPGLSAETHDVTAHDSPSAFMEYVGGRKNGGEVSADGFLDPTAHATLIPDLAVTTDYELSFPDGSVWAFAAIFTKFETDAPSDGTISVSLAWKVTGVPTFTPVA